MAAQNPVLEQINPSICRIRVIIVALFNNPCSLIIFVTEILDQRLQPSWQLMQHVQGRGGFLCTPKWKQHPLLEKMFLLYYFHLWWLKGRPIIWKFSLKLSLHSCINHNQQSIITWNFDSNSLLCFMSLASYKEPHYSMFVMYIHHNACITY